MPLVQREHVHVEVLFYAILYPKRNYRITYGNFPAPCNLVPRHKQGAAAALLLMFFVHRLRSGP
jgi:hypothetical protein